MYDVNNCRRKIKSWHVYLKVLITLSHHYDVCIGWILSIDVKIYDNRIFTRKLTLKINHQ